MGACNFTTVARGKTAADAFDTAVRDARYDYGHAGYTGTIAEKSGYVEFALPSGVTADDLEWAISIHLYIDEGVDDDDEYVAKHRPTYEKVLAALGRSTFVRLYEIYDNKWGPAVAVRTAKDTWTFMGYASS